jgi:hypothetical protein
MLIQIEISFFFQFCKLGEVNDFLNHIWSKSEPTLKKLKKTITALCLKDVLTVSYNFAILIQIEPSFYLIL